ncbi:MAG: elongation factor P [Anaerolineae bacterium]|jgi:elongation factor P|nr:elongation factor P [Anaerolineae bacterium]
MIDVNELRKGVTFEYEGGLWKVMDYSHNKPGRGKATIRIKANNMRTGVNVEMTFNSGTRVQDVRLEYRNLQYLYSDSEFYYFMDNETYEQMPVETSIVGGARNYLVENMEAKLTFHEGKVIDIELPLNVDLRVTGAEVAVRGDTATGLTKKVTVQTGVQVAVPSFVEQGDLIRVNTTTGEYVTRVKE